jgi:hypothetical protein
MGDWQIATPTEIRIERSSFDPEPDMETFAVGDQPMDTPEFLYHLAEIGTGGEIQPPSDD